MKKWINKIKIDYLYSKMNDHFGNMRYQDCLNAIHKLCKIISPTIEILIFKCLCHLSYGNW